MNGHRYAYIRNSNLTLEILEHKLALLEGGEACTVFSTGMAAITAIFFSFLKAYDRLLSVRDLYGGTYLLFSRFLPKWGVDIRLVPTDEDDLIKVSAWDTGRPTSVRLRRYSVHQP